MRTGCTRVGRIGVSTLLRQLNVYIYIYIYTYIYIYIVYLVRHGNRQDVFYGFRRRNHPTFCNGFRRWLFNGFRRGRERFFMVSVVGFLFMVSVVAGKYLFMVSALATASEG